MLEHPGDERSPLEEIILSHPIRRAQEFLGRHFYITTAGLAAAYTASYIATYPDFSTPWAAIFPWVSSNIAYARIMENLYSSFPSGEKEVVLRAMHFAKRHPSVATLPIFLRIVGPSLLNSSINSPEQLPQALLKMGVMYYSASQIGWLFTGALGGFLNKRVLPGSIRLSWAKQKYRITGDRRHLASALQYYEGVQNTDGYRRAAELSQQMGNLDTAMEFYKRASTGISSDSMLAGFRHLSILRPLWATYRSIHFALEKKPEILLAMAMALYVMNNYDAGTAVRILRPGKRLFGRDLGFMLASSLLLDAAKAQESTQQWRDTFSLVLQMPIEINHMGETVNMVWHVSPSQHPFLAYEYVFKQNELKKLEAEVRVGNFPRKATLKRQDLGLVEILVPGTEYETIGGRKAIMVMRRAPGENLYDCVQAEGYFVHREHMLKAAELTGICHAATPLEASEVGGLDLKAKAKARLSDPSLRAHLLEGGMPDKEYDTLVTHMVTHMCHVLEERAVNAVNFDSHPQQFIVGQKIIRVDTEDKGITPAAMDFANLFVYFRPDSAMLPEGEIASLIEHYLEGYNEYIIDGKRGIMDTEGFFRQALSLGLERVVSLTSAWSSGARPSMWQKRADVLRNGMDAIELLEARFHMHYAANEGAYAGLHAGFERMADALTPRT